MKVFIVVILISFLSCSLFAQKLTPKVVEDSLIKAFDKINYWVDKRTTDTTGTAIDSIIDASDGFSEKLARYTTKYPFTMSQKFARLSKYPIAILTSSDGRFRIYSWDTQMGGTQHANESIFQYKSGVKVFSITSSGTNDEGLLDYFCNGLHTIKVGSKSYYLVISNNNLSQTMRGTELRVFTIDNGVLNTKAKLIKNKYGLRYNIAYSYAYSMDSIDRVGITYDAKAKTIKFPVVYDAQVYDKVITYKFTGKYFEKVNN
jgi:hypothetical protein